jgi:hypothetical protein
MSERGIMNMRQYARSRGRNYSTVRVLCRKHGIGERVGDRRILSEEDIAELDGRRR